MKVSTILFVSVLAASMTMNLAHAKKWPAASDPAKMDSHYEYHFYSLPLKGSLNADQIPWSETYWPRNKGSINIRWNAPGTPGFDYHLLTKTELQTATKAQLAQLSPSEKYDLAMGHYDYPLTHEVAKTRAKKDAKYWEGLCDGWTASALQFKEPKPVEITNPDGLVIPFGSSDVKGLMAYYVSEYQDLQNAQVGAYCGIMNGAFCPELNAGAFHVILANEIGLKHQGFGSDIDSGREIWNQPVYGFEYEVVGSAFSLNAKNALRIKAKMHYTSELDQSLWNPVLGTEQFKSDTQEVEYILEMDENHVITGGHWLTRRHHPDNFWKPTLPIVFKDKFEGMNQIYQY